jgi:hypothetical protein
VWLALGQKEGPELPATGAVSAAVSFPDWSVGPDLSLRIALLMDSCDLSGRIRGISTSGVTMIRVLAVATTTALVVTSTVALAKTLRGSNGNDTLVGTPRADVIYAFAGDDDIYGGAGNDRLSGGTGKDHLWGGNGNDTIFGGPQGDLAPNTPFYRHERIFGGAGNDVIVMRVAGSILFAGSGNDRIDVRDPQSDCKIRPGDRGPASASAAGSARGPASVSGPQRKLDPPHCVNLVNTGPGDNFVRADDGNHDSISCVGRRDRVIIDQYDVAPEECEVIRRVER